MKYRTDFVTNSSSSSFLLAKKGKLNQKQRDAIIDYIEKEFFGQEILSKNNIENIEQLAEENWKIQSNKASIEDNIKNGYSVQKGTIDWECGVEYEYQMFLKNIWRLAEENGEDNFKIIDGDLRY